MLANGTGERDREGGRRHLVLPHRRLRVRPGARARHRGVVQGERRQGARAGATSARARRTSRRSCCRRRRRRPRSSASPMPAATRSTRSSRRPSSASSRAARSSPGCWCSSPTCTSLGLATAQGLILTETFYWDLNDQTRAFAEALRARKTRAPSDDGACRRLFGDAALPEGGRGG